MTVASRKSAVKRFSCRNWTRLVTPAFFAFSFASRMRSGSMSIPVALMPYLRAAGIPMRPRRRDRDAAGAGAEVVEHVAFLHVGETQHVFDHFLRRRHEDDVRVLRG